MNDQHRQVSRRRRGPARAPRRAHPVQPTARTAAIEALATQVRKAPDFSLSALDERGLDARDAALARAIYGAAMRRWLTLWGLIEPMLDKPRASLDARVAGALLAGAAQIVLLDRIPAHAACDESVGWIKRVAGQSKGRLVNAILRELCRLVLDENDCKSIGDDDADARDRIPLDDGRTLQLRTPVLPTDPLRRLSIVTSTPLILLREWVRQHSMREARRLALHGIVEPPIIMNTAHASSELPSSLRPHRVPGHHVFDGTSDQLRDLLAQRQDIWVQDPASSLAVEGASDLDPRVVIDLCAGKGTKTRQLERTFPEARIVATDKDETRFGVLRRSVQSTRVEVVEFESIEQEAGRADLVLLDVPCTNTGVLARRVEARYRFDDGRRSRLVELQRQILVRAISLLSPQAASRGGILYSTCSLDRMENEDQAAWVRRWHAMEIGRERRRGVEGGPGDDSAQYSDGSFAALLA